MIDNRTKHPYLTEEENAARHREKQLKKDAKKKKPRKSEWIPSKSIVQKKEPKKQKPTPKNNWDRRPKYRPGMGGEFYKTREWMEVRYHAIKKLGLKCACCGDRGKETIFHVDHIKPRSRFPFLELELENLQILCESCNIGKSNTDTINWQNERDKAGT